MSEAEEQRWVTVVIAVKAADFDQWCKDHGKNPRDRNFLMATPASARGLKDAHLEVTAKRRHHDAHTAKPQDLFDTILSGEDMSSGI